MGTRIPRTTIIFTSGVSYTLLWWDSPLSQMDVLCCLVENYRVLTLMFLTLPKLNYNKRKKEMEEKINPCWARLGKKMDQLVVYTSLNRINNFHPIICIKIIDTHKSCQFEEGCQVDF